MPKYITEDQIEQFSLALLQKLGYEHVYGPDIAPVPDGKTPEREGYKDILLKSRLERNLKRINPKATGEMIEEAIRKLERTDSPNQVLNNQAFHKMLTEGIDIDVKEKGRNTTKKLQLIDFENPNNNEFTAINQYTIIEGQHNRRPDILIFVNGIPLAIIELKNIADEKATIEAAFNQIQTYKAQIPGLFRFNQLVLLSDGKEAKVGTITSNLEWFVQWKLIDGKTIEDPSLSALEVVLKGLLKPETFLRFIRHFILYEQTQTDLVKKMAQYHQFRAVNNAIISTIKATKKDHRAGVVWHTQGSGKSLSMVFYTGLLVLEQELENPTIIVLTDRNDLDGQLFDTFAACKSILRQTPTQAESRNHLKELLKKPAGGIVFTTIQKFFPDTENRRYPKLSDRENIIVIADEAHRTQYGVIDGFARHMHDALPNASFIGFTGTPIELADRDTRAIFGDYVDVYSITQAVRDKATVPIYYESRLAKIELPEKEKPKVDEQFEEVTEGEESKEQLKSRWSRLEALVGSEKRIKQVSKDIVTHFEHRTQAMEGKALIVCMSRRICVEMYKEIVKIKPEWHDDNDKKGAVKVIMTGNATDPLDWQPHIRNKPLRKEIETHFKKSDSELKIVIVRDMWLTGTDIPCLHTIYVDKPMRGHGLMQAIARVNRVFKDKPGGLVVDYIGLAEALKLALSNYTREDRSETGIEKEKAVAEMLKNYEIARDMLHGVSYKPFLVAPIKEKFIVIQTIQRLLEKKDGKEKFIQYVEKLAKAFALAYPHEKAFEIRDEVAFFQAIKVQFVKYTLSPSQSSPYLDTAVRQIVAGAIVSEEVVDIFDAVGIKKPDISVLSQEFMDEVRNMPQKNLALELLRKLINDEIKTRTKKNLIKSKQFSDMLEEAIHNYQNRSIDSAQVIEELIELAKKIKIENTRGATTGLTDDELAFYDALADNESALKILGDKKLQDLSRELVRTMKKNRAIDWTLRESIQAEMRSQVKRLLRKYGYPPDKQQKAMETVMEQTKLLYENWIGEDEVWRD